MNDLVYDMLIASKNKKITNAIDLLKLAMETIEPKMIAGPEKAEIVIEVLRFMVNDAVIQKFIDPLVLNDTQIFLNSDLLKPTIDIIIAGINGNLEINVKKAQKLVAATGQTTVRKNNGIFGASAYK